MNNPVDQPKVSELDADEMSLIDAHAPRPILRRLNEYVEARLAVRNSRKQTYLAAEERVRAAYAALRDEFAAIPQPLIGIPGAEKFEDWSGMDGVPLDGSPVSLLLSSGREVDQAWWGVSAISDTEDFDGIEGWRTHTGWARGEDEEVIRWRPWRSPLNRAPAPTSERVQAAPAGFVRIDMATANQIINDTLEEAAAIAKYGMERAQRDYRTESPHSHVYQMAEEIYDAIRALNHKSS